MASFFTGSDGKKKAVSMRLPPTVRMSPTPASLYQRFGRFLPSQVNVVLRTIAKSHARELLTV